VVPSLHLRRPRCTLFPYTTLFRSAGDPNWSTVNPDAVPFPGATGDAVTTMLQHGDPAGTAWRPGETDTSIRPGWFYHAAEDDRRSEEHTSELQSRFDLVCRLLLEK